MSDVLMSGAGILLMTLGMGVGNGLIVETPSRRARAGAALVILAFLALAVGAFGEAIIWAIPLFIIVLGVTALASTAVRYSRTPLLVAEPGWRKLVLVLTHGRRVREVAREADGQELVDS